MGDFEGFSSHLGKYRVKDANFSWKHLLTDFVLKDVRINCSLEQGSGGPLAQHDEESVGVLNAEPKFNISIGKSEKLQGLNDSKKPQGIASSALLRCFIKSLPQPMH